MRYENERFRFVAHRHFTRIDFLPTVTILYHRYVGKLIFAVSFLLFSVELWCFLKERKCGLR